MTASIDDVTDYKPYKQGSNQVKVEVASGALLDAIGEGVLHKTLKGNGNSKIHVKFQRTLIVPGLCSTLICLMQMLTPGENESECDLHIVKGRASLVFAKGTVTVKVPLSTVGNLLTATMSSE